jgi:methyl-accepting chemotaxis protein
MLGLLKSSVVYQLVLTALLFIVMTAALVAGAINYSLGNFVMQDALDDAKAASRAMAILYGTTQKTASVSVVDEKLTAVTDKAIPTFEDYSLVDRAAQSFSGVATVFARQGGDYVRVSTNVIAKDGKRAVGTKLAADHPAQAVLARGEPYFGPAVLFERNFMTGYFPVKDGGGNNVGVLFIGIPMEVYHAKIEHLQWLSIIVGAMSAVGFAILSFFLFRARMRGLVVLTSAVQEISSGRLDSEVPCLKDANEFGRIARALEIFRENALAKIDMEREVQRTAEAAEAERQTRDAEKLESDRHTEFAVRSLADGLARLVDGDLSRTIETPFTGHLESLRTDFNNSIIRVRDTLAEIQQTSRVIQSNGGQMSSAADDLSKRSEQQAATLEETAAAVEEITATVRTSSERAGETSKLVEKARRNADSSTGIVENAIAAMGRIRDASDKISQIIDVIDGIAFQTNLLALNAGVEAARAGDAGKGFAVVAQEVRELAQRSANAAKEIGSLIGRSAEEVATGSRYVGETGDALLAISREIVEISSHVDMIATSAREQSVSLSEVNGSVNQMDQMTQRNAAMVEETNAATRQLAQEADTLMTLVEQFKLSNQHAADSGQNRRAA